MPVLHPAHCVLLFLKCFFSKSNVGTSLTLSENPSLDEHPESRQNLLSAEEDANEVHDEEEEILFELRSFGNTRCRSGSVKADDPSSAQRGDSGNTLDRGSVVPNLPM